MFCLKCGKTISNAEKPCPKCGNSDRNSHENSYQKEDLIAALLSEDVNYSLIWGTMQPKPLKVHKASHATSQAASNPVDSARAEETWDSAAHSFVSTPLSTARSFAEVGSCDSQEQDGVEPEENDPKLMMAAAALFAACLIALIVLIFLAISGRNSEETVQVLEVETSETTMTDVTDMAEIVEETTTVEVVTTDAAVPTATGTTTNPTVDNSLRVEDLAAYQSVQFVDDFLQDPNEYMKQLYSEENIAFAMETCLKQLLQEEGSGSNLISRKSVQVNESQIQVDGNNLQYKLIPKGDVAGGKEISGYLDNTANAGFSFDYLEDDILIGTCESVSLGTIEFQDTDNNGTVDSLIIEGTVYRYFWCNSTKDEQYLGTNGTYFYYYHPDSDLDLESTREYLVKYNQTEGITFYLLKDKVAYEIDSVWFTDAVDSGSGEESSSSLYGSVSSSDGGVG